MVPLPPVPFLDRTDSHRGTRAGKETVDKNCPSCKKRVVRTAVSVTAITAGDRHRFLLRCVKQRFLNNVSSNSPISILKGLTVDAAAKLHTFCEEMLRRRCRTLAELATLTDNEIMVGPARARAERAVAFALTQQFCMYVRQAVQMRDRSIFRNLLALRNSALALVDFEAQDVSLKRRTRNALCCAHFRQKRKEKVRACVPCQHSMVAMAHTRRPRTRAQALGWQTTVETMTVRCQQLTERLNALIQERDHLAAVAMRMPAIAGTLAAAPIVPRYAA